MGDCYYPIIPEVLLLSVGLRNVFGFGISYAVIPWIIAVGYRKAFGTMVSIHCAILGLGPPFWYWARRFDMSQPSGNLLIGDFKVSKVEY